MELNTATLEKGYDVNYVDNLGYSVLHRACEKGNLEIVKALCEAGADVNKNCKGYYPIDIATKNGFLDIVKYLIETYSVKLTNVVLAAYYGKINILNYLLTLNLELNCEYNNPLYWACMNGQIDAIDRLLNAGADPNIIDSFLHEPTIFRAIEKGRLDIVDRLVLSGANCDVQYQGQTLVQASSKLGKTLVGY